MGMRKNAPLDGSHKNGRSDGVCLGGCRLPIVGVFGEGCCGNFWDKTFNS